MRNVLLLSLIFIFLLSSCQIETGNEYQQFIKANINRPLYILNGSGETISAYNSDDGSIYNNLQILGSSSSSAIPNDIYIWDNNIYVLLSGQNSIECYDGTTLDYIGRCYLKNGFNPLSFIPVSDSGYAFITGYLTDEIVLVNLEIMELASSFIDVYEPVELSEEAHSESKGSITQKNGTGDNKRRGPTGGVVVCNGSNSLLFVSNVRYDSKILLTDFNGNLIEDSGSNIRANGYFREGTLSIFSFNSTALSQANISLIREINLDSVLREAAGEEDYYPGDGLNPQTLYLLNNDLHVICTGTNGGSIRYFDSGTYIPEGYADGDPIPGTDPDDGIILILKIFETGEVDYYHHLAIGDSPVGFRNSIDTINENVFLAGVGGVYCYHHGKEVNNNYIINGNENPVLRADESSSDYYSGLLYDSLIENLYISFFTSSQLLIYSVNNQSENPAFSPLTSVQTGDGPGALAIQN